MMSERSQLVLEEASNLEDPENACRHRCPKVLLASIGIYLVLLVCFLAIAVLIRKDSARPHIIFIVVDDLGWNDVQWNDADMRTPALQALLDGGVFMNSSYAHPMDSPSRASIFTGIYPFHMGLQREKMAPYTPTFVPDNFTLLSSHMQDMGYRTHLVGKWHLGFCDWKYTPTSRGFQSFSGFYTDNLGYYSHRDSEGFYDFRTQEAVDMHAAGTHSTEVLTERATRVIFNHDVSLPLFLVVAFKPYTRPLKCPRAT